MRHACEIRGGYVRDGVAGPLEACGKPAVDYIEVDSGEDQLMATPRKMWVCAGHFDRLTRVSAKPGVIGFYKPPREA